MQHIIILFIKKSTTCTHKTYKKYAILPPICFSSELCTVHNTPTIQEHNPLLIDTNIRISYVNSTISSVIQQGEIHIYK